MDPSDPFSHSRKYLRSFSCLLCRQALDRVGVRRQLVRHGNEGSEEKAREDEQEVGAGCHWGLVLTGGLKDAPSGKLREVYHPGLGDEGDEPDIAAARRTLEEQVRTCSYRVCRMVAEQRVKTCTKQVPVCTTRPVHSTKTVDVVRMVPKQVAYTVTRCVPKTVYREVPCCE
jgi:hypothetical protein